MRNWKKCFTTIKFKYLAQNGIMSIKETATALHNVISYSQISEKPGHVYRERENILNKECFSSPFPIVVASEEGKIKITTTLAEGWLHTAAQNDYSKNRHTMHARELGCFAGLQAPWCLRRKDTTHQLWLIWWSAYSHYCNSHPWMFLNQKTFKVVAWLVTLISMVITTEA